MDFFGFNLRTRFESLIVMQGPNLEAGSKGTLPESSLANRKLEGGKAMRKRLSLIGVLVCVGIVLALAGSPLLAKPSSQDRGDRLLAKYQRAKAKLIRLQNRKLDQLERQFNHVVEQKIANGETEDLDEYVANMNRKLEHILAKGEQKLTRLVTKTNKRLNKIGDSRLLDLPTELLDLPTHDPLVPPDFE